MAEESANAARRVRNRSHGGDRLLKVKGDTYIYGFRTPIEPIGGALPSYFNDLNRLAKVRHATISSSPTSMYSLKLGT